MAPRAPPRLDRSLSSAPPTRGDATSGAIAAAVAAPAPGCLASFASSSTAASASRTSRTLLPLRAGYDSAPRAEHRPRPGALRHALFAAHRRRHGPLRRGRERDRHPHHGPLVFRLLPHLRASASAPIGAAAPVRLRPSSSRALRTLTRSTNTELAALPAVALRSAPQPLRGAGCAAVEAALSARSRGRDHLKDQLILVH